MASGSYDTRRLESFSDGVIAVAITLMVLRIDPPVAGPGSTLADVFMRETLPAIIYFLITFAVIVIFWRHHHDAFARLPARCTPLTFVVNMAFLAMVCLLPFGLELFNDDPASLLTVGVYAGLMCIATLLLNALWWTATGRVRPEGIAGAVVFLMAIPLAPLVGGWSLIVWWLDVPVGWFIQWRRNRAA